MIDQKAYDAILPEIESGETVLWAARPNPSVIFRSEDLFLIPFSLLWGGFAIFWEASVLGLTSFSRSAHPAPSFFALWGIPFVVMGQYVIWGRFLTAEWKKRRTFYAVTDRRVMVIQIGASKKISVAFLDSLPMLLRESGPRGIGTLRFNPAPTIISQRGRFQVGCWNESISGSMPVLRDIDDVDSVQELVSGLRQKLECVIKLAI